MDRQVPADRTFPDKTALGAVKSGSILFAICILQMHHTTLKNVMNRLCL